MGGSFNPAHAGHLHISESALRMLDLDQVWWLVSPQNPLKSSDGMQTLDARLEQADEISYVNPRIFPTDIEVDLGTRYTCDTLPALVSKFPDTAFVWLMGADNLSTVVLSSVVSSSCFIPRIIWVISNSFVQQ